MSTNRNADYFGPFKIIRPLGSTRGVERFVVLCNKTDTNRLLYRFPIQPNHQHRRALFDQMVALSMLDHPHLLKIESASYDDRGRLCMISPYPGNHEGLVTLADLLGQHGGRFTIHEAARAIEHLLSASAYAHARGIIHGAITPEQILVDRFGSTQIELYAHPPKSRSSTAQSQSLLTDEIRSIAELGYKLITGLDVSADRISPTRVLKRLDRNWDTWFDLGLDPLDGFENATHALNALPTNPNCAEWLSTTSVKRPQVHLGSVIRRFRASPQSTGRQGK
ncbi:MAG: protein kinase family protein [Phycisphaerales bacterium]|nr:protein kinase family protein [Phycisphaerales bacterium]